MIPSNYHTHTQFCDGKNSPEEIVHEAICLGCPEVGFSGHSYTFFDESYCMTQTGTQEYIAEIRALQEKYRGKIKILLGVEQDYYETVADVYRKTWCQIVGHFD
ncbi:MAG: PHP domain-containing protein [Lachnospiraceae bacterium]|nr:PHP domain-containing protein [Lachnospiraceae bacterium]